MPLFNLFTSVKLEQLFFFFSLILSHNGTKWPLLATLQQAAKRPRCKEMEEKVWSRHGGRENSAAMWSARELAPLHLSWYKHYFFFFFLFQQRIRESLTGAADGRGSHRLQKYLEVYTSQTKSQIGIRTEALLWRGKGSILKYILFTFLLIFLPPPEVWILAEWQQRWVRLQKFHQVRPDTVRFGGHSGVTGREQGTLVLAPKQMCFLLQRFENTGDVPLLRMSQSPDIPSTPSSFCFFQGQTNFMIARSK